MCLFSLSLFTFFLMLVLLNKTIFWTNIYDLYFSHYYKKHYKLYFFLMELCGQLSCTASTPVFLTCGYSSCSCTSALSWSWISYIPSLLAFKLSNHWRVMSQIKFEWIIPFYSELIIISLAGIWTLNLTRSKPLC